MELEQLACEMVKFLNCPFGRKGGGGGEFAEAATSKPPMQLSWLTDVFAEWGLRREGSWWRQFI